MTASLKASDALNPLAAPATQLAGGLRDRAQTSRLSADFDRILRKKDPTPKPQKPDPNAQAADKPKPAADTDAKPPETNGAEKPQGETETSPAGQTDGEHEAQQADNSPEPQPQSTKDANQPKDAKAENAGPDGAAHVEEHEEAPEQPQLQLSQPTQLPDTRPVTIRSLNALLLQGTKPSPLATAARDAATSQKPAAAGSIQTPSDARLEAQETSSLDTNSAARDLDNNQQPSFNQPGAQPQPPSEPSQPRRSTCTTDAQHSATASSDPARLQSDASSSPTPLAAAANPQQPQATPRLTTPTSATRSADPLAALSKSGGGGELAGIRSAGSNPDRAAILRTESTSSAKPLNQEQAFAAQLVRGVAAAMKQGSGSVTIRLNPESLGQLKIQIQLPQAESGHVVSARFEASSQDAKHMLEQSFAGLRDSLESRGLTVGTLESTLSQPKPEAAAQIASGTPNAEVPPDRHSLDAPARQDSSTPDDHTAGYGAGNGGAHGDPWSGQDARHHGYDGLGEFVHAESLDAAARSAGLIANMRGAVGEGVGGSDLGRSPGFYRTNSTDGGAVRVVVDAVA